MELTCCFYDGFTQTVVPYHTSIAIASLKQGLILNEAMLKRC